MDNDCQAPLQTTIHLTARQRLVLQMVADGHPVQYIAVLLDLNPNTVKRHIHNVKRKLGARSLPQAVGIAAARRMVSIPRLPELGNEEL